MKNAKSMFLNQNLKILGAKTVWFLGIAAISSKLPSIIAETYYLIANVIDRLLKKTSLCRDKTGVIFVVAQKHEKYGEYE